MYGDEIHDDCSKWNLLLLDAKWWNVFKRKQLSLRTERLSDGSESLYAKREHLPDDGRHNRGNVSKRYKFSRRCLPPGM